jgi:xylulokinase
VAQLAAAACPKKFTQVVYHAAVLVLGVDLGTQSLKVVACDAATLEVRGSHAVPYATHAPRPGWAEQAPADWEAALGPAIAGALAAAHAVPHEVAALAIAAQLDGCIVTDASGAALHPALIWHDRRAHDHAAIHDPLDLFERTGQIADASHLAPKARWLATTGGITAAHIHEPTTYLVARLTGERVIDPALASTTMLFDLAAQAWSPALTGAFGITAAQLPRVTPATQLAGTLHARGAALTGLPVGTPVAVGTGDDFSTPLGAGLAAPGMAVCAIGTAEVVGALSAQPTLDRATAEPMVETHAYPSGAFFVENPGWMAGGAVRWAVRLLGCADDAAFDRLAATAPPGSDGVTFIPALAGAMTPTWRPHARGTLHGLAASHGPQHIARGVLEGLAFASRDVIERLAALGLATDDVLVLGGGAASATWNQIRADILARPHHVCARTDTSAIGAAMIAAVAAGAHADLRAAARFAPPIATIVTPGAALDDAYARYRRLVAELADLSTTPW